MTDYDNTNSGAMFINDRKTNDRQPDRNGSAEIECPDCGAKTEFWVAGWIRTAKRTGQKFMSLAFTAKEETPQAAAPDNGYDEDIPF